MATTITIPDGYQVQMQPNGQFQIIPSQQVGFNPQPIHYENYEKSDKYIEDSSDDQLIDGININYIKSKKLNLSREERKLLEFCHSIDMREFLREEFEKHPLYYDDEGNLKKGW